MATTVISKSSINVTSSGSGTFSSVNPATNSGIGYTPGSSSQYTVMTAVAATGGDQLIINGAPFPLPANTPITFYIPPTLGVTRTQSATQFSVVWTFFSNT